MKSLRLDFIFSAPTTMMPLLAVPRRLLLLRSFATSSSTESFFSYNSGRARRRRQRALWKRREEERYRQMSFDPKDEVDRRTVRDILFPDPHRDETKKREWSLPSLNRLRPAMVKAWGEYRSTWEGFSSPGFLVEDKKADDSASTAQPNLEAKGKEVYDNAKRNADFLQKEAMDLRQTVRETTGIHSTEDLKRVAAEWMKLMTTCLQEFMVGYRKGRDDEVEKMLTQYFQEMEKEMDQPKRRKRKRRSTAQKLRF